MKILALAALASILVGLGVAFAIEATAQYRLQHVTLKQVEDAIPWKEMYQERLAEDVNATYPAPRKR